MLCRGSDEQRVFSYSGLADSVLERRSVYSYKFIRRFIRPLNTGVFHRNRVHLALSHSHRTKVNIRLGYCQRRSGRTCLHIRDSEVVKVGYLVIGCHRLIIKGSIVSPHNAHIGIAVIHLALYGLNIRTGLETVAHL